ncbi:hypothetical protein Q9L58_010095 [Maublancomyces gigas]|uniref:Uncharacterized protein n=1 Tax=Discina gigas TaxID=1032678 RepID=A0ABR3G542_9PEZI
MAFVFDITWEITKPNLSTAESMKKASGIGGQRFNELRKSFGEADISVDLSLKTPEGQNRFVREVHAWLNQELSQEEKQAIFCPERPLAPFIMCHIAAYFKKLVRCCEKKKNKKRIAQEQCLEEQDHGRSAGGPADEENSDEDGPDGNSPEGSEVGIDEMADAGNEDPIWQGFSGVDESMIEPDQEFEYDQTGIDQSMILEEADRDFELESEDVNDDLTGIDQSMILEQADREYELESEDVDVELVEREMEEPEAGPEAGPEADSDSDRARHTREIDELIASATRLRAAMLEWDAARFASEVSVEYKTLHNLIPIPPNPASTSTSASASASGSPREKAAYTSFYAKIRNNLESVRDDLEQRKPKFEQIWGPEVRNSTMGAHFRRLIQSKPSGNPTPFMVVAAGPSGGGKTHSMIRPNPADPPVLQQLLLEAFLKYGDLKMAVSVMSGKNSVPVPVFDPTSKVDPTSKGKGKGRGNAPPLRQFLTSEMEIHESVNDLMSHIPSSDNSVNRISSRSHAVIDVFTEGLLVFTIIDLCGDESSEVRGRLAANKESSDRIAGDLSFLKRLFTDLKLATAPSKLMNPESWRSQGIVGRDCALTAAFLNRLTMVPKLHVVMFGHGTSEQSKKDLIRSLNVWSPPVVAGRAIDDKPRAIIGGKRSRANDVDGKQSKRPKFQR